MRYIRLFFFPIGLACFSAGCASVPRGDFNPTHSAAPDYHQSGNWAALPFRHDSADAVPIPAWHDMQSNAGVDVFFLHPTTYTGRNGEHEWNADLDDEKLNQRTDETTIRYQASVFNGAGKIYAPRYRQAHLNCFYTVRHKAEAKEALDLAYTDIEKAFDYYLTHFNEGRPFILAAHSQGTFHAARLIREHIEGTPVEKQLVVAYLAGMPVRANYFKTLKPCLTPVETDCFCSWRTFKEGYLPEKEHMPEEGIVVTNPITWDVRQSDAKEEAHLGAVLRGFDSVTPHLLHARVHEDLLWVNKPKFPGSFLLTTKNYHIADYNFFYADIRHNAQVRAEAFLEKY